MALVHSARCCRDHKLGAEPSGGLPAKDRKGELSTLACRNGVATVLTLTYVVVFEARFSHLLRISALRSSAASHIGRRPAMQRRGMSVYDRT